jgi:four helix bundle protein
MATITRFEDLEIWKMARELADKVYKIYSTSEIFSKDYKLKDQINGASGSVMDNIAEGFERNGRNEFINFLSFAKGSCGEVKSQFYRALDREYISSEKFNDLYNRADRLGKKIGAFIKYLNTATIKGSKYKDRKETMNATQPETLNSKP